MAPLYCVFCMCVKIPTKIFGFTSYSVTATPCLIQPLEGLLTCDWSCPLDECAYYSVMTLQ